MDKTQKPRSVSMDVAFAIGAAMAGQPSIPNAVYTTVSENTFGDKLRTTIDPEIMDEGKIGSDLMGLLHGRIAGLVGSTLSEAVEELTCDRP